MCVPRGARDFLGTEYVQEACSRYPNVEAIVAYMPEPFGTHHSKMMILLRHDDLAQYECQAIAQDY